MTNKPAYQVSLASDSQNTVSFDCQGDELILNAAKRQGIFMASYCKQGACGACGSKLISGEIDYARKVRGVLQQPNPGDEVRPCSLKPCSDVVLEPIAAWRLATD